jgi:hypothetical protein
LDYSVETVLLKNECDYISVEQRKDSTRRKKREQLLDVTNKSQLTTEDVREFEMR